MTMKFGYVGYVRPENVFIINGAKNLAEALEIMAKNMQKWDWKTSIDASQFTIQATRNNQTIDVQVELARIIDINCD